MTRKYWLMKSEPDVFSIDHLARDGRGHWDGVRNYQARNYMRDGMSPDDLVLFYHSNASPPGVAGVAKVVSKAVPDFTAWDRKSDFYDPRSTPDKPVWYMVDVAFVEKFPGLVSLDDLRSNPALDGMLVLKRGMRLSIQPVDKRHFDAVRAMARGR